MNIQATVAKDKEAHPERYCPEPRCLWRTDERDKYPTGYCPRHESVAEMIRRDRLARAEAIGRTIRPNYTGD